MKKLLLALLLVLFVGGLMGCGGGETTTPTKVDNTTK